MTLKQSNYIKVLAMISMLIDHAGLILFPQIQILRIIGRISFPLLAYQIGIGYAHTRNLKQYFLRLIGFGVTMQGLYFVAGKIFNFDATSQYLNVFFVLALGLAAIFALRNQRYFLLCIILLLPPILSLFQITIDYGLYGIVLILLLDTFRDSPLYMTITMAMANLVFWVAKDISTIQLYSLVAILPLVRPLSLKWRIPSAAFYLFYPLHLAILYGISMLF